MCSTIDERPQQQKKHKKPPILAHTSNLEKKYKKIQWTSKKRRKKAPPPSPPKKNKRCRTTHTQKKQFLLREGKRNNNDKTNTHTKKNKKQTQKKTHTHTQANKITYQQKKTKKNTPLFTVCEPVSSNNPQSSVLATRGDGERMSVCGVRGVGRVRGRKTGREAEVGGRVSDFSFVRYLRPAFLPLVSTSFSWTFFVLHIFIQSIAEYSLSQRVRGQKKISGGERQKKREKKQYKKKHPIRVVTHTHSLSLPCNIPLYSAVSPTLSLPLTLSLSPSFIPNAFLKALLPHALIHTPPLFFTRPRDTKNGRGRAGQGRSTAG